MMLRNEIATLENFQGKSDPELRAAALTCQAAWSAAAFSAATDETLRRYFSYQLAATGDLVQALAGAGRPAAVGNSLEMIDHLFRYYPKFIDCGQPCPAAYRELVISRFQYQADSFAGATAAPDYGYLHLMLNNHFQRLQAAEELSYEQLFYLRDLISHLWECSLSPEFSPEKLTDRLIALNYNRCEFLAFFRRWLEGQLSAQSSITDRIAFLNDQKNRVLAIACRQHGADTQAPALKMMLGALLDEFIRAATADTSSNSSAAPEKQALNLSVAHLALLTKLFSLEGVFGDTQLKTLIRFISGNYKTKRQVQISETSFSKEMYSTTQVTAAFVRDLLQRMINRIDRDFFH